MHTTDNTHLIIIDVIILIILDEAFNMKCFVFLCYFISQVQIIK